jgi:hypothetical protein
MSTTVPAALRGLVCALGALAMLSAGCSEDAKEADGPAPLALEGDIVAVPRELTPDTVHQLREGLGSAASALQAHTPETFYLALKKSELGQRWFMSAYLKQNYPEDLAGAGGSSLGIRVVSFQQQNGKLFAFDVDDTKVRSTLYAPEEIVEAWPVVTDHRAFNRLPNADKYVLFDPAAGLDRVVGMDLLRNALYGPVFEVDLAFAQRFRALKDGISFEKVITGRGQLFDQGFPSTWPEADNYRVTATLSISFRRYQEGAGYTPTPLPPKEHYFRSAPRRVPNSGGQVVETADKWNIHPGMKPITWVLSDTWAAAQQDPRYQGYDIIGAAKRGVEAWNAAFGFTVFTTRMALPGESFADDDKNFVLLDPDPSYSFAYANWRSNPNTGEVLGAGVYMNISWLDRAIEVITGEAPLASGVKRAVAPLGSFQLQWNGMTASRLCELHVPEAEAVLPAPQSGKLSQSSLSTKERVERFFGHVVTHEIGHTLGLRHNFKGSLSFPTHSVMEYSYALDQEHRDGPGAYDVAAVRYLYGLSSTLPQEAFCTDEDLFRDPDCTRYDSTPVPLEQFYGAMYRDALRASLEEGGPAPTDAVLNGVLQYVRGGRTSAELMRAWSIAMEGLQAPIPPEVLAAHPGYGLAADAAARRVIQRLYLDSAALRSSVRNDPRPHPTLTPAILEQLRANLLNVDGVRSYATRRVMVQVLKKLQTYEAYAILREARITVEAQLPLLTGKELLEAEDLAARLQQATSPYFQ